MKLLNIFLAFALFSVLMIGGVSASDYPEHQLSTDLTFTATSNNASSCNVTTITSSEGITVLNRVMAKNSQTFYTTISASNFSMFGRHCFDVECYDASGITATSSSEQFCWTVTSTGDSMNSLQGYLIIGFIGLTALLLTIGFSFEKAKWKLRSLFFMASLLMGVITLNSIRIIAGGSTSLNSMGEIGLILGIVILSFMFLFLLINYTIEVFQYFKKKRANKWEVSNQAE